MTLCIQTSYQPCGPASWSASCMRIAGSRFSFARLWYIAVNLCGKSSLLVCRMCNTSAGSCYSSSHLQHASTALQNVYYLIPACRMHGILAGARCRSCFTLMQLHSLAACFTSQEQDIGCLLTGCAAHLQVQLHLLVACYSKPIELCQTWIVWCLLTGCIAPQQHRSRHKSQYTLMQLCPLVACFTSKQ